MEHTTDHQPLGHRVIDVDPASLTPDSSCLCDSMVHSKKQGSCKFLPVMLY